MWIAAVTGFLVSASLILAIGAQNAFVLRQGLLRRHVGPLVLFCGVSDLILISAGVAGFGVAVQAAPWLPVVMTLAGAVFVGAYGVLRLRDAWRGDYEATRTGEAGSLRAALGTAATLTWLNPHVYLDTLALLGAVSTRFEGVPSKIAFGAGASAASFVFFAALGYGASALAPLMRSARAWRMLDVLIGATMLLLAAGLAGSLL